MVKAGGELAAGTQAEVSACVLERRREDVLLGGQSAVVLRNPLGI